MDHKIFWQLNEAYQLGVCNQVQEETLSEEEYLDIEEWVEALIEEGYDLDQYTDDELYEAYLAESRGGKANSPDPISMPPSFHKLSRGLKKIKGNKPLWDKEGTQTGRFHTIQLKKRGQPPYNEELDLYDLVSEYLVSEGFCDSYEDADVIMANMSEEWREGILEEVLDEELTGPRREYALNRANQLRTLSKDGYRRVSGPKRELSKSLDKKAADLTRVAANTQGRGWENQPRKRGGSGAKGDPKEMDYGVTHDRSQKTPKDLIKSKLLKRAKREINRR